MNAVAIDTPLSIALDPSVARTNHDPGSQRVFRDAVTQLRGLLQEMRVSRGAFVLKPVVQKTWKSQARILIRGEETHNRDRAFYVRLKPGDNGTAWDYVLTVPDDMSARELQAQMAVFVAKHHGGGSIDDDRPPCVPPVVGNEATPPVVNQAASPTQELGNLFQRLHNALQRKEQRDGEIADLQARIQEISQERQRLEQICLELIEAGEQDKEASDAQALLATLRNFTQPERN